MEKKSILIVEDEQISALDLKETLTSLGYRVTAIATSGEKAIDLTDAEVPDLILMDIHLAGKLSGIQAAAKIVEHHRVPIIYLTAYADPELVEEAKQTRPYGYIIKPYDVRSLRTEIEIAFYRFGLDEELKREYARLEQRVQERTVDLEQANEALHRANRQLHLMTSITRHDILNKVSAILAYVAMARKRAPEHGIADLVTHIESATNDIRSQIAFTRVYQDLGSHEPQWQEPGHLLGSPFPVPDTIILHADLPGIQIYADPMLEKVFFNLLDNSIRHGGHVTEIRVFSSRREDDLAIIWEDNGIGVLEEEKDQIFERGFGKNTGLGLFLVREILSLTGITILETGVPGKGARFEIIIPKGAYRFLPDKPGGSGKSL